MTKTSDDRDLFFQTHIHTHARTHMHTNARKNYTDIKIECIFVLSKSGKPLFINKELISKEKKYSICSFSCLSALNSFDRP